MIQKLYGPRGSTAVAPYRPPSTKPETDSKTTQSWGSWRDGRHYRLDVIQQPIRARMCGFGDKDRRPLAPATVAKLVVHDENDNPIDETDIDYSFFVVTADLWSVDGVSERNLVLHPTPSANHNGRDAPTSSSSSKRRRTTGPAPDPPPLHSPPAQQIPLTLGSPPSISLTIPTLPNLPSLALSHPYGQPPSPPPPSSSASSTMGGGGTASSPFAPSWPYMDTASWPSPLEPTFSLPTLPRSIELPSAPPTPAPALHPDNRRPSSTSASSPATTGTGGSTAAATMYAPASRPARRPLPGHAYTRTLVGPLAASACRLFDQHRNPGVFFLFQDLSVRTEGSFRLRLRLMNIGAPPVDTESLPGVITGSSPILAQTFTDSFDVYSAKRFPGVPDTTALSIAFGNQGQKLPLRNRHGSRKDGRRRRRGDDSDSDRDSDG